MNPTPDDPCDYLQQDRAADADPAFRAALLRDTSRVLRGKRWRRRAALVTALAACYAAGLGTMKLWFGAGPSPVNSWVAESLPQDQAATTHVVAVALDEPAAIELETVAHLAPRPQQAELYRQAADRYWQDSQNVQAALRCYRLALQLGPPEQWHVCVDDNWLLMALKQAKQREKNHANADG